MALSGSFDYNETCSQIITDALIALGQLGRGETASTNQLTEGRNVLNKMVKMWQGKHIFLWTLEFIQHTITLSSEVTGTDGNNYTCILGHTATADDRPITGLNWKTFWTLEGSSGVSWTLSSAYTSAGDFLVGNYRGIDSAALRQESGDKPLPVIYRKQFFNISNHYAFGSPDCIYFNPLLSNRAYLRPIPTDINDVVHYTGVKLLNDFDQTTDDPDAPAMALMALTCNLAYWWRTAFNVDTARANELRADAKDSLKYLLGGNKEMTTENTVKPAWTLRRPTRWRIG